MVGKKIILSLDTSEREYAEKILKDTHSYFAGVKIGMETFYSLGKEWVRDICFRYKKNGDFFLMLDLKFHDIPHTVERAVDAVLDLEPDYITIHASGGSSMLRSAMKAVRNTKTKIVAVTLLTSLGKDDIADLGLRDITDFVLRLTTIAYNAGIRWAVCSLDHVPMIKERFSDIHCMIPGLRMQHNRDDHKRVGILTKDTKLHNNFIIVGRPILEAKDPVKEVKRWSLETLRK